MAHDALDRAESCGGHFRTEHQTEEGEALRHDDKFHVRILLGVPRRGQRSCHVERGFEL